MKRLAATLAFLLSLGAFVALIKAPDGVSTNILVVVGGLAMCVVCASAFVWFASTVGGDEK